MLDHVRGWLEYDEELECWYGEANFDDQVVQFVLWPNSEDATLGADEQSIFRDLFQRARVVLPDIRVAAAAIMTECVATSPGHPLHPLPFTELLEALALTGLEFSLEGRITAYFRANHLLRGHSLVALADAEGAVCAAELKG